MLAKDTNLKKDILGKEVEMISTREGFGQGLVELGEENENVVALCGDLTNSTKIGPFKERFPEIYRSWNCRTKHGKRSSWTSVAR